MLAHAFNYFAQLLRLQPKSDHGTAPGIIPMRGPGGSFNGSTSSQFAALRIWWLVRPRLLCGKISYLSQDRVGLNSDGSIASAGTSSGSPSLVLMSKSHPTTLMGTTSGRIDSVFVDLAMPRPV